MARIPIIDNDIAVRYGDEDTGKILHPGVPSPKKQTSSSTHQSSSSTSHGGGGTSLPEERSYANLGLDEEKMAYIHRRPTASSGDVIDRNSIANISADAQEDMAKLLAQSGIHGYTGGLEGLYAYTDQTTNLIATQRTGEGNLFIRSTGESIITLRQFNFTPVRWAGIVTHFAPEIPYHYKTQSLSIEAQNLLKQSGIASVFGTPLPKEVTKPLVIGQRIDPNAKEAPAVFIERSTSGITDSEEAADRRYMVRNRVPDSVSYHYTRQMSDSSVPGIKKEHAQYAQPPSDYYHFETELAKARYLTGMPPYLTEDNARNFDHFTYWKYKMSNPGNAFHGAFIHIFISRPDLHLFDRYKTTFTLRDDVMSNAELASLCYMCPDGAVSLVGKWQSKAVTDINLFLSNRAIGLDLGAESLGTHETVEGFNGIKQLFGGRFDNPNGQIDITFSETQDLSVSNTITLWMKYIGETYIGSLSPLVDSSHPINRSTFSYNTGYLHPMWRRIDSLASMYIIATDMTQRNIIFWRKYFGLFPAGNSYAGLSPSGDGKIAEGIRKVTIPFKYTTFRTNNIVDLYAFNRLSDIRRALNNGSNIFMRDNRYQVRDPNTVEDHDVIAGLPFVAIDQSINPTINNYNKTVPQSMYLPQLLFTRSDGAFIPQNSSTYSSWVVKNWGTGIIPATKS